MTFKKLSDEFGKWSDRSKAVFIGSMFLLSVGCAYYFIPEHQANERVPMVVDNQTGARVCPAILGCDVGPSQIEGFCYFKEDC